MPRFLRRELVFTIITSLSILVLVGLGLWLVPKPARTATGTPTPSTTAIGSKLTSPFGLTVTIPRGLTASNQATTLTAAGTLWELRPAADQTPFVITADYEQGDSIKKLVQGSKKSPRDAMADNLSRQLPAQYPGYHLLDKRNMSQHGTDGLEINFTYTNEGQTVRQRLLLLVKNDSAAAYLRAQAIESDFEALSKRYFEPILASALFS